MVVEDRRSWRKVRAKGGSHAAWPSLARPRGFSQGPPAIIAHNVFGTSSASATCTIRKPTITAIPAKCSARGLKAAKQRDQPGELYRLPDSHSGNHLGDAGKNDDDVEQLLHRVVDRDVLVRDLEVQRVD